MPAIMSHWLLGNRILPELYKTVGLTEVDESCFFWGCQGPDVLFFSRLAPWMCGQNVRSYGYAIHNDRPSALFRALSELLKVCEHRYYDPLLSYCLGVCCHYSLDRTAHPYIYQLEHRLQASDNRGSDYHYHAEIEAMLDIMLLRRETGKLPCEVDLCDCLPDDASAKKIIALAYTKVLYRMFGVKLDARVASTLVDDMRLVAWSLNNPLNVRRSIINLGERAIGKGKSNGAMSAFMRPYTEDLRYDYANVCHGEWYSEVAPDVCSTESYYDLFDKAIEDTRELMDNFMKAMRGIGTFEQYTQDISF